MIAALARFFTERVFGPDRAAMLTTQLPASAAGQAERRDKQAAAIRRKTRPDRHRRDRPHHRTGNPRRPRPTPPPRPSASGSAPGSPTSTASAPPWKPS